MKTVRTQVGIVGAGPAGLMLAHLLHRAGIDSVVLESRSRDYVEKRVRAGVLEPGTVRKLTEAGVGDRLRREGLDHDGFELRYDGERFRIDLTGLAGAPITIYGQQEVVKDLIDARIAACDPPRFEIPDVSLHGVDSEAPELHCTVGGEPTRFIADFIAGCDGFHGISRDAATTRGLRVFQRDYPLAWVGILVAAPPSSDELIYASHTRGFALHSMRSPEITRLYVQAGPTDSIDAWPDERIWEELHARLAAPGWTLREGRVLEKGITGMRSFVAEPMQFGRLFLAGDAAHIVPPTGAKGLNLAIADVSVLALGLADWYRGNHNALDRYSETCLRRVWRAQDFSATMTAMLHRFPGDEDGFERRRQLAQLRQVARSTAAATVLAENYIGSIR